MRFLNIIFTIFLIFFCYPVFASTELSLDDAILLAVRSNPNVQSSRLNLVLQKFNVDVAAWQFSPQYSFESSTTYTKTNSVGHSSDGTTIYSIQPAVALQSPFGTQVTVSAPVANTGSFNAGLSLQVMQPLLRGFGKPIVEAALNNAKDSEVISRLTMQQILQNTISTVINSYLDVVAAEKLIVIDNDALKRATQSVEQTKLFIKAGHKAGNELVTVQSNVASAQLQLINDKNNLAQMRYALLASIGIDPSSAVRLKPVNLTTLQNKYRDQVKSIININKMKKLVLDNDIQYQIDNITLHGGTTRSLLIAEDNSRWQLNLSANASTGSGFTNDHETFVQGLFNGTNRTQSVSLTLNVPIDNHLLKQGILNAKVAIKEAELGLLQEKWSKETAAINGKNNIDSASRSLAYAQTVENLQEQTYQISYQKYLHGLIDSLELQSAQMQFIQSQQSLLSARMNYIKTLVNIDMLTGQTLKTWNIETKQ